VAVRWSRCSSREISTFGFVRIVSVSKGRNCATMKCVLCGKTMEVGKDTGVTCRDCEKKEGPQMVVYCVTCGSEKVVIGTIYCKNHGGRRS